MIKRYSVTLIPLLIGLGIAELLYFLTHWWGFWFIFPWIGLALSIGIFLQRFLKGKKKLLGRKVAILLTLPCLLIFVPVVNNENFQLEGVAMIVMVGFFHKGFIHYAIAKIFGPLIWRRGFCGYSCWTAAVLDWLPIKGKSESISRKYRNLRYLTLFLSLGIPFYLITVLSYDPRADYINQKEMVWMFAGNGIYYLIAIPLAFILSDRRAFCKYVCPVALVMKPTSSIGLLKLKPDTSVECIECGKCNQICPMGVDVMYYMKNNLPIKDSECVLCNDCEIICPVNKIH